MVIPPRPAAPPPASDKAFGYKTAWIAVRSDDMEAVALAAGLRNPAWASWGDGIRRSYENCLAVLPPVNGWVLVTGQRLFDALLQYPPEETKTDRIAALSRQFGEAQAFCTHRVSEGHMWLRCRDGVVERLVACVQGEGYQEGEPTFFENDLPGLADDEYFEVDEDMVMRVAADWSVAPILFDEPDEYEIDDGYVLVDG